VILGEVDKAVWDSKNGEFSSSEIWEKLRVTDPIADWHKVVWFPASIPKHSFVLWLAFHGALITKEKCVAGVLMEIVLACSVMLF
jgi:hypothetical protein